MRRKNNKPPGNEPPEDPKSDQQVKGMIPFPCCPKESVMAYAEAHGRSSNKCPKCGRFAVFDFDRMSAEPGKPCRGASDQYRNTPQ